MGIKKFKPVTPTLRYRTVSDFAEVTKSEPEKSLLDSRLQLIRLRADRSATAAELHYLTGDTR